MKYSLKLHCFCLIEGDTCICVPLCSVTAVLLYIAGANLNHVEADSKCTENVYKTCAVIVAQNSLRDILKNLCRCVDDSEVNDSE